MQRRNTVECMSRKERRLKIKIFNREICVYALLATNSFNATSQHS